MELSILFSLLRNIVSIISLFNYSHIRFETMSYSILSLIKSRAANIPISPFMFWV